MLAPSRAKTAPPRSALQPRINTTHIDHSNHADEIDATPTQADLDIMERLMRVDQQLYEAASARFEKDVRTAGLGCWLPENVAG